MARTGLTKSQVRATRDRLVAEGRYPSVDAVRHALGDSGSKSTIHRFLKELRDEEPDGATRREETGNALHALVEQLADRLHLDFDERVRAVRADYERTLRDKEAELAALRRTVDALEARLARQDEDALSGFPPDPLWTLHSPRPGSVSSLSDGFGSFGGAQLNSRSCSNDVSPFNMIRVAGR
jgi:BMFP domain-containing protein YqiC